MKSKLLDHSVNLYSYVEVAPLFSSLKPYNFLNHYFQILFFPFEK